MYGTYTSLYIRSKKNHPKSRNQKESDPPNPPRAGMAIGIPGHPRASGWMRQRCWWATAPWSIQGVRVHGDPNDQHLGEKTGHFCHQENDFINTYLDYVGICWGTSNNMLKFMLSKNEPKPRRSVVLSTSNAMFSLCSWPKKCLRKIWTNPNGIMKIYGLCQLWIHLQKRGVGDEQLADLFAKTYRIETLCSGIMIHGNMNRNELNR